MKMASFQQFLHHSRAPSESPAKIFAKLKSKVQEKVLSDVPNDECRAAGFHGVLGTPKKMKAEAGVHLDMFGNGEVTALTLSPISSPQKTIGCRAEDERLHCEEAKHALKLAYMPQLTPFMESTAVCNTTQQAHMNGLVTGARWLADHSVRCAPGDLQDAPGSVFSPVKTRQRKRTLDGQLLNKANNALSDMDRVHCHEKERKIGRAFSEDDHYISMRDVDPVVLKHTGCSVDTAPPHPVTPAKIFAFLKEKENQRDQCDVQQVPSRIRPEAEWDHLSDVNKEPDHAGSRVQILQSPDLDEDVPHDPVSTVPLQPVVLEDPLLLCSPRVSIPKVQQPVFKRNKWPKSTTFPSETVIHLRKWFIRRSHNGLFVDGICRENDIPWNSNIIAKRVSSTVLKTVTGRIYVLDGKMDMNAPSPFPKWFVKSFVNGFPSNWKEIYENYLSESKGLKRGSKTQSTKRSQKLRTPMDQSLQRQQQKSCVPLCAAPAESCPSPATPSVQVSRSGRLIKPPLDYWRGGRVIVDAHMNVTIHDGYDSVIQPEVTASVSTKSVSIVPAKKTSPVKVPLNDDREQRESIPKSQLQRKVKAPQHKSHTTSSNVKEKPPSPVNHIPTGRITRSRLKCLASDETSEDSELQESKNTKKKTNKQQKVRKAKPVKVNQQPASRQRSPSVDTSCSSQPLSRRQEKENIFKKTGAKRTSEKSPMKHSRRSSRSSHSSQERDSFKSHKTQSKTSRKPRSKSPSPMLAQIATQAPAQTKRTCRRVVRNKHSLVIDEDAWTEDELRKLQEAVSCHPQHVTGYWTKVAMMVGTRSADECHKQHTSQGASKTPAKRERKMNKKAPLKEKVDNAVISARVGTLRRKQQVRDFLEAMPKEDMDDVFSSAYMQSKRFEVPSMCPSDDDDFTMSNQDPLTPKPTGFPEAKTPQCLHITPGMMGSSSRNYDDKYVFQLQKRMKNQHQFNVQKHAPKNLSPTASVKKVMRRCGNTENDTFVVWEMFPDKEAQADSGEEEDFYFSEDY